MTSDKYKNSILMKTEQAHNYFFLGVFGVFGDLAFF